MMALRTLGVQIVEVVGTELFVWVTVAEYVIDDDEQAMGDGDSGLFGSSSASNAPELRMEVGGAGPDAGPSNLAHDRTQPDVAVVHGCLHAHSRALLVTWAEPSPRGQVPSSRKATHIGADLSQNRRRRDRFDARNGLQQRQRLFVRRQATL